MFLFLTILFLSIPEFPVTWESYYCPETNTPSMAKPAPPSFKPMKQAEKLEWDRGYWVKVVIRTAQPAQLVLMSDRWYIQNLDFYDSDFQLIGQKQPRVKLSMDSGRSTYYVYFPPSDDLGNRNLKIRLIETNVFDRELLVRVIAQSTFHATLLFILIISLIFLVWTGDMLYFHYALYITSSVIFFLYQEGFHESFLSFFKDIVPIFSWSFSNAITMSYLLFLSSFLNLKAHSSKGYRGVKMAVYFEAFLFTFEILCAWMSWDIQHSTLYKSTVMTTELLVAIFIIYHVFKLRTKLSHIFILGSLVLALVSIFTQIAQLINFEIGFPFVMQAGILVEVFIFNVGIGTRIGLIYKEREQAQTELIDQLRLNEKLQQDYTLELERKVRERTYELEKQNHENETLLKEIHHRVKNNLQMISSLISMQNRRLKDPKNQEILKITQNRVRSIGLIHEHLYQNDQLSRIDLETYIQDLTRILIHSLHDQKKKVNLEYQLDPVKVSIDQSISIGLILNELITNAIKYGFRNNPRPMLRLSLQIVNGNLILEVADNGSGTRQFREGFGWTIINATLDSIDGQTSIRHESGFHVKLTIPALEVVPFSN